jgi:hypothetical protein
VNPEASASPDPGAVDGPVSIRAGSLPSPVPEDRSPSCWRGTAQSGVPSRQTRIESPAVLDGARNAVTFLEACPRSPATNQKGLPEPEDVMLIWAWIKRRRAAKRAKLLPKTESPNPPPPSATS